MESITKSDKRETILLKSQMGGTFGSKLTFTVGTAYLSFGAVGFLMGLVKIKKPNFSFPTKRIMLSYYLNNMMRTGLKYAHSASTASLIYTLTGYLITKGFEDELYFLSNRVKNTVIGAIAGGLYMSSTNIKAIVIGSIMGAGIIFSANTITDYLRERDVIALLVILFKLKPNI